LMASQIGDVGVVEMAVDAAAPPQGAHAGEPDAELQREGESTD
jgi:hypothetical protein